MLHEETTGASLQIRLNYAINNLSTNAGNSGSISGSGKIPWRKKLQPTPIFLPGESHGQRSLVGYSPWGCKELDMTQRLSHIPGKIHQASKQLTHWKSPWCWERLRAEGVEGIRGWDGWTASLMQWARKWKWSRSVRLFATPWAVAHQAPLSMGFSRQEYWSGLPFPSLEVSRGGSI